MKTLILFFALISFSNVYSQDTLYFNTIESGDSSCICKSEVIIDASDSTEVLFEVTINDTTFNIVCEKKDTVNYTAEENEMSIDNINFIMGKMGPFITITYDTDRKPLWLYNSKGWFK
jgi:hypothetical protein